MTTFLWILLGGVVMSAIPLVGSVSMLLEERTLRRLPLPMVAFAAGNFLYMAASDLVPEFGG